MDLRQLEMFIAVAEHSSFTIAGQRLNVAQSAVSRQLKMLETELGEPLLKRVHKRVYLTPAGETMIRGARNIFQELRNTVIEISDIATLNRGRIRLGGGMTACIYLFPTILEQFRSLHPGIEIEVITGSAEAMIRQIRSNLIDIGVLTLPVNLRDLETIPFQSEQLVVVASKSHPVLGKKKVMSPQELAEFPLILFGRGTNTRELLDRFFAAAGITPQLAMEGECTETIKPLVKINLGISILPVCSVETEVARGELNVLTIRGYELKRELGLVFQKSERQPRALAELVKLFRRQARNQAR